METGKNQLIEGRGTEVTSSGRGEREERWRIVVKAGCGASCVERYGEGV